MKRLLLFFGLITLYSSALASFDMSKIINHPEALHQFMVEFPKGGELHNHLAGGVSPQEMMKIAQNSGLCLNYKTLTFKKIKDCEPQYQIQNIKPGSKIYNEIVRAWSFQKPLKPGESNHDHFFNAFPKFITLLDGRRGLMLADEVKKAYKQHVIYLELILAPNERPDLALGNKIKWTENYSDMQQALLEAGIMKYIRQTIRNTNAMTFQSNQALHCGNQSSNEACGVNVNYLYFVLRESNDAQAFAQLYFAFMLAHYDARYAGIQLVQAEDGPLSMENYLAQMKMIEYLHREFQDVNITLHAGELTQKMVGPKGVRNHIDQAVRIGHAQRIGHGVDIRHENHFPALLKLMREQGILVEINLVSNKVILGVKGNESPLMTYINAGVPVALSTDDQGILNTTITEQFEIAARDYHLTYEQLKMLARNSLSYSFARGEGLWENNETLIPKKPCKHALESGEFDRGCQVFLERNPKANLQWKLEEQFKAFEAKYENHA